MTDQESRSYGDTLRVRIDFHGPFRVGTGQAAPGIHQTAEVDDPLPASSLKGLMRASARALFAKPRTDSGPAGDHPLLRAVFGAQGSPTPWAWSSADFEDDGPPRTLVRARTAIDSQTGTVRDNHLRFAEEHWARTATFTVTRTGLLPPAERDDQLTVLTCAAAGIHTLGGERRRGLGWVTCTPLTPAVDDELLDRFESLREQHA